VVAAEPITDVDTTAADMLEELDEALNAQGISLVVADMKDPVREKIDRYELTPDHRPRALLPHRESCRGRVPGPVRADWAPPPRRVL
jgi:MFS superfamily sulfate permease-like transporter